MDTESGGEEFQSRCKKGHMINIYLKDSDEEAIVDFVRDHEDLYNKTNKLFQDTARKDFCGKDSQASATFQ